MPDRELINTRTDQTPQPRDKGDGKQTRRKENQLRDASDQLLSEMRTLKNLEQEKRAQEISTPQFHKLASVIEAKSRDIFALANNERLIGDEIEHRLGVATEDIAPEDSRRPGAGRAPARQGESAGRSLGRRSR
jgi:hypothetical protein